MNRAVACTTFGDRVNRQSSTLEPLDNGSPRRRANYLNKNSVKANIRNMEK